MPEFFDSGMYLHQRGGLDASYQVALQDVAANVKYFGYVNDVGAWLIMQQNVSAGTFKWTSGKSDLPTSWALRAALEYNYWDVMMKGLRDD
jgi:hypothetical protein